MELFLDLNLKLVSYFIKRKLFKSYEKWYFVSPKKVLFILKVFKFLLFLYQVILPGKLDKFFIECNVLVKWEISLSFEQDHYFPLEFTLIIGGLYWDGWVFNRKQQGFILMPCHFKMANIISIFWSCVKTLGRLLQILFRILAFAERIQVSSPKESVVS